MAEPLTLPRADHAADPPPGWPTPAFGGSGRSLRAAARRALDLQAASIWDDLSALLGRVRGSLLDVGCGAQPYRELVPAGVAYSGVDRAGVAARFGYEVPDTTYYEGDRLPVADAAFDALLCTETLEHVPDPAPFLAELRRVLRPGGHLIVTVPFAARWHYVPHDYWRFTPSCLARLFAQAGFAGVAVYPRGNALTVACYKTLALILPLLVPAGGTAAGRLGRRLLGLLLSPAALILAAVGHLSLRGRGGADCLGYTAVATAAEPRVEGDAR